MKTLMIRALVLGLAVTGLTAVSVSSSALSAKTGTKVAMASPTPLCAPSDPSHCGLQ